jgi:DNA polymerase-3 subunit chi
VAEFLFYHLTQAPLSRALPEVLTRSLQRGWRVVLRAGAADRLPYLDEMLWTHDEASFLPHGTAAMGHEADQPVYLTAGRENPNGARVLMLVEGARVAVDEAAAWDRICLFFDDSSPDSIQNARADWVAVRDAGLSGKYWAQEDGRWMEKAATGSAASSRP